MILTIILIWLLINAISMIFMLYYEEWSKIDKDFILNLMCVITSIPVMIIALKLIRKLIEKTKNRK